MPLDRPPPYFVGDHLALDFLNTIASPQGQIIDWLCDGQDLVRWLEQSGAIKPAVAARMRKSERDALDDVAREAREFRQWLRKFVTARKGKRLRATAATVAPLNELLATDKSYPQVEAAGNDAETGYPLRLRRVHRWENPAELLVPIAEAAADLICHQDFRMIRSCDGSPCILLFLDRTKAHARRWCSMTICGNRAKSIAHRARKARNKKSS
jgi:predicted RNA-binding Zn ribbon-like protein